MWTTPASKTMQSQDNPSVHASRIDSAADAVAERPYNQRSQSRIAGPTNVVIELH
jgi:hypothetical protein